MQCKNNAPVGRCGTGLSRFQDSDRVVGKSAVLGFGSYHVVTPVNPAECAEFFPCPTSRWNGVVLGQSSAGVKEAGGRLGISGEIGGESPSAAQAGIDSDGFMRGLKIPCSLRCYSAARLSSASAAKARPGSSTPATSRRLRGRDFPVRTPRPRSISTWRIRLPRPSLSFFMAFE